MERLDIDYIKYHNKWSFIYAGNNNTTELTENKIAFIGYGNDNDLNGLDIKDKGVLLISENINDGISKIKELSKKHNTTTFYLITNDKSESIKFFNNYFISHSAKIVKPEPFIDYNIKSSFIDDTTSTYRVFFITKTIFTDITNFKYKKLKKLTEKNQKSSDNLLEALPTYKLEHYIDFEYNTNKLETENVIGYIENNPNSDSTIIFCGHYDHIGKFKSYVYNGADDNASGTSAVLELAKAYSDAKKDEFKSKYNYMFIAFTGEELGLFGSKYYVDNPVKPLNKNTLVINMDMIGRVDKKHTDKPDYVYVLKRKLESNELKKAVKSTAKSTVSIDTDFTPGLYKRLLFSIGSDHQSFAKKGIPNFVFFTGLHEDYHKHTDTADKIDFDKLKKITELIFLSTYEISEVK